MKVLRGPRPTSPPCRGMRADRAVRAPTWPGSSLPGTPAGGDVGGPGFRRPVSLGAGGPAPSGPLASTQPGRHSPPSPAARPGPAASMRGPCAAIWGAVPPLALLVGLLLHAGHAVDLAAPPARTAPAFLWGTVPGVDIFSHGQPHSTSYAVRSVRDLEPAGNMLAHIWATLARPSFITSRFLRVWLNAGFAP